MIYVTQFRRSDKQVIGVSSDSGMASFDQVRMMMGEPVSDSHPRILVYGEGEDRTAFSDFPFRLEVTQQ